MPATLTYPGVYVEEIPSGVRTITGVPTSITAFVGSAVRGPINDPVSLFSFGDYERTFGGLSLSSPMSYAVRDFYLNGGSQAVVVRLVGQGATTTNLTAGGLALTAASPGAWGANLSASVDVLTNANAAGTKAALGLAPTDTLFTLTVQDISPGGATEVFLNLTVAAGSVRRVDRVVNGTSQLVTVAFDPANPPTVTSGKDAQTQARLDQAAQNDPRRLLAPPAAPPAKAAKTDAASASTADAAPVPAAPTTPAAPAASDGAPLAPTDYNGDEFTKTGLFALEKTDIFNLLCIPPPTFADGSAPDTPTAVYQVALPYCVQRRALLLVDSPADWASASDITANDEAKLTALTLSGTDARNAAVYFPRVLEADPLSGGRIGPFVPCGVVAGVMSRTDAQRGVWKAPAGLDASLNGTMGLEHPMTNGENGLLNPLGVNCLRTFPVFGSVVWGARTLRGADQAADEYKYVPVRRLALFIEESLYRGTQWIVFEPNDEPLWSQIRLNVGAFMQNLFRQGAFQGSTPRDAYFVKCDKESTTQNDINLGIVNIVVGFAPLKPAEFVVLQLQQMAGQIVV
jgi:phage tail sheath protein FI